jgi:hypothetical protein
MFNVMNKNKPIAPDIETRSYDALAAVTENGRGKTREHNPTPSTPIEKRRKDAYDRIIKNGRGTRSHGRRPEKTTKKDFSPITKSLGFLAFTGVALVGAASYNNHKVNEVESKLRNTSTTEVIAEPGSSYADAQGKLGYSGLNHNAVIDYVMGLPENDDDKNGKADPVHPGDKITVLNFNEDKQP